MKIKIALNHNCIGKTLSIGKLGNKNPNREQKPFKVKKMIIIHTILFININKYYFMLCCINYN